MQYQVPLMTFALLHCLPQREKLVEARIAEYKARQQLGRLGKEEVRAAAGGGVIEFACVYVCAYAWSCVCLKGGKD